MFILASQSPRRKEILSLFNLPFEQINPTFNERSHLYQGNAIDYVQTLAKAKATSIAEEYPDRLILSADTIVHLEGKILEKPISESEAIDMLSSLNGRWHDVYTAIAIQKNDHCFCEVERTRVQMHQLTREQLLRYHQIFQNYDKAGGYGLQRAGSIIVKQIEGCFYNAMGLGIASLAKVLKAMKIDLWDYLQK